MSPTTHVPPARAAAAAAADPPPRQHSSQHLAQFTVLETDDPPASYPRRPRSGLGSSAVAAGHGRGDCGEDPDEAEPEAALATIAGGGRTTCILRGAGGAAAAAAPPRCWRRWRRWQRGAGCGAACCPRPEPQPPAARPPSPDAFPVITPRAACLRPSACRAVRTSCTRRPRARCNPLARRLAQRASDAAPPRWER